MKVKVFFMITKRSIRWKWKCYLWLRKDQYDEIESVIKDHEKLNMMKVKILSKLTRKSRWWKRKFYQWSQVDQHDEIESVINDQKKINMTKVNVSARFTFCCGVLLRLDDDCRPADDLVCLHLFHNGDDVDDYHFDDVWWSLWWYMMLLPQSCRSWLCSAHLRK